MQTFDKLAISIDKQISLLEERGLLIKDRSQATQALTYIGYYHLSAYELPFQKADGSSNHHTFIPGTTFQQILDAYTFDRRLRLLVMDAIERIEIALRAVIINEMSIPYGPHWYTDREYFIPEFNHDDLLQRIQQDIDYGKDPTKIRDICIRHYYENYDAPSLPPIWMVFEALSFSKISIIFKNLNHADKKRIAETLKLPVRVLGSWLHSIVYTRNLCAHHQRLWNRVFTIKPLISHHVKGISAELAYNSKFYAQAVVIHAIMQTLSPDSKWTDRLEDLFRDYPEINQRLMGFPDGWKKRPFWN